MNLAIKDIIDPRKGLFKLSANGVTLQPHPLSSLVPNYLLHFKYIGRLIARGLISRINLEVDFTRSLLKQILQKRLSINDLEDIDPEQAKNLIWLL